MWKDLGASWAILLGIGFMMLANGLQGTLLGVRASLEGFSTFTTGILMSGYFIGIFIGSIVAPFLMKRVGHIRVFSALASMASISILFHGVYLDPAVWMVMRIITGICFAGFYVVTESWLNERASNATRGKVLSIYMLIVTGAMGGGQFLLNLAQPGQIDLFILISVIISVGLIPILLTAQPAPSFGSSGKMSLFDLYKASPLAVIGNGLTGMAHGTLFGLGAIYASSVFTDLKSISWFMASFLLGSLVTQWPIGYLSDHIGRRAVMASLSIIAIICSLAALYVDKSGWLIFAVMLLLGGAAMPMYSVCVAYANDRLEPHQIVAASGSLVMVSGIGLMTGPILVAFLMEFFFMDVYFWGIAGFFMLILMFTLLRMNSREGIAIKDQSPLVAGPIGTPIAEYNAPDSVEYAEAVSSDDFDYLDQFNEEVEREE